GPHSILSDPKDRRVVLGSTRGRRPSGFRQEGFGVLPPASRLSIANDRKRRDLAVALCNCIPGEASSTSRWQTVANQVVGWLQQTPCVFGCHPDQCSFGYGDLMKAPQRVLP